jgi:tight adherence protein C
VWDALQARLADTHLMAILLAAVGSAATVVAAAMPWLQPDTLGRRIRAVSSERERIRARERERLASSQAKATLRSKPTGVLKQIVESLNLSSWLGTETAKAQLAMAGYRGPVAEYLFLTFRLLAPVACFLVTVVYVFFVLRLNQPMMVKLGRRWPRAMSGSRRRNCFCETRSSRGSAVLSARSPTRSISC